MTINLLAADMIPLLQFLAQQTFVETFANSNTETDMQQYIQDKLNIDQLLLEWKNPDSQFYIAYQQDKAIGYMKLNQGQAQTVIQAPEGLEIERIYILKEFQSLGYGASYA